MDVNAPNLDTPKSIILAGLLGSLLSLGFINDMGLKRRFIAVIAGIIFAHYLTPLIAFLLHEDNYQATIGFLVGLFGMSIIAAVFRAIQNSDLWGLIRSRFGGQNQNGGGQ